MFYNYNENENITYINIMIYMEQKYVHNTVKPFITLGSCHYLVSLQFVQEEKNNLYQLLY